MQNKFKFYAKCFAILYLQANNDININLYTVYFRTQNNKDYYPERKNPALLSEIFS